MKIALQFKLPLQHTGPLECPRVSMVVLEQTISKYWWGPRGHRRAGNVITRQVLEYVSIWLMGTTKDGHKPHATKVKEWCFLPLTFLLNQCIESKNSRQLSQFRLRTSRLMRHWYLRRSKWLVARESCTRCICGNEFRVSASCLGIALLKVNISHLISMNSAQAGDLVHSKTKRARQLYTTIE